VLRPAFLYDRDTFVVAYSQWVSFLIRIGGDCDEETVNLVVGRDDVDHLSRAGRGSRRWSARKAATGMGAKS
jgi:hypothetical protein